MSSATSKGYSPYRNNEESDEQPKKLVGSKRPLFETSNDTKQDSAQSKRPRVDEMDEEAVDSSSLKCLETLIKLILAQERKQNHSEEKINLLTEFADNLLTKEHCVLLQHSNLLSNVAFLAQEK